MNSIVVISAIVIGVLLIGFFSSKHDKGENRNDKIRYGIPSVTKNREVVRSRGEKIIADYLDEIGVSYIYEPDLGGLKPDFLIGPKLVIEYWGMANLNNTTGTKYRKIMKYKLKKYNKMGYRVISLFQPQIRDGNFKSIITHILHRE